MTGRLDLCVHLGCSPLPGLPFLNVGDADLGFELSTGGVLIQGPPCPSPTTSRAAALPSLVPSDHLLLEAGHVSSWG